MMNLILQLLENETLKTVFLKLTNMSISASWLVLAVLVLRLALKKAPKWVNVVLWGIVAVRLICPFSIESALSLIPSTETIPMNIEMAARPAIDSGIDMVNSALNPIISASFTPNPGASANPLQIWIPVASVIWLLGMVGMALYTAISYLRLYRMLNTAVRYEKNIFQSENVTTPFVLGIFRPRIYLPFQIAEGDLAHVIAHEQAHICRKDHWWKPLGFLLLTIHWFNPLMWLAYVLLCRDIELACDEKVIQKLGNDQRADYTQALVSCSVNRRMIAACPLAFGEVGVKDRVKSIMNYRKPTFWIIITAFFVCVVVSVCFLTNPLEGITVLVNGEYYISEMLYSHTPVYEENFVPSDRYSITSDHQLSEKNEDGLWISLGEMKAYPLTNKELYSYNLEGWHRHYPIRKITDAYVLCVENDFFYFLFQTKDGKTYLAYGWEDIGERGQAGSDDTGLRRLYRLESASNSNVTKWFDYTEDRTEMSYDEELKIQLDAFPGITFKYTPYDIIATTSWDESDDAGKTFLISGMPIWNAYFCDITGDGKPEICSQVSYGSGIIDNRVIIFDYANGISYKLEDRGNYDYYLRLQDGWLYVDKWDYMSNLPISSGKLAFTNGAIKVEGVESDPVTVLQAELMEIYDSYYIVEPISGSMELSIADKIEIPIKNIESSPEPQIGDILEIEYNGQLQESYPARISNPYKIKVIKEAETWDRIPMVMVNGTLYLDTGKESTVMVRCGMMDGEITSQVPGNEEPTVDDQSNFGIGYGYQYGPVEGTIEIFLNDKWWVFATEEARKEIQFPSEETNGELMIDPVVPVTVVNLITEEMKIVNSNPSIRAIQSLISSEWWAEGNPACDNDYKITVNDESYWYHSDCGTLTDINHDSCITLNESQKAAMDVLIEVGQDSDFDRYWLTVGEDGVKRIEIKTAYSSSGCENADGSLYQKGDRIWLECLDGFLDLRGVSFTALDEHGQIIWQASIPDGEDNEGFTHLRNNDWNITNIP